MAPLKAGDKAPEVTFRTADRQEIKLSDYRGKQNVIVAFYVRAFTGG